MPSCSNNAYNYDHELRSKRVAYRKKLIAKGVMDGSSKMMKLMHREGL